jgi:hypothetical protein
MATQPPSETGPSPEVQSAQTEEPLRATMTRWFVWIAILQVVLITGLLIVVLQLQSLPMATAALAPYSDSGAQADAVAQPVADGVQYLRTELDTVAGQLTQVCSALAHANGQTPGPDPCAGLTTTTPSKTP